MDKIVKVIIKGTSGYCSIEDAYKEKITITQNKVKYHFLPEILKKDRPEYIDLENYPPRLPETKLSMNFGANLQCCPFEKVADFALEVLNKQEQGMCCDIGATIITVVYDNGAKLTNTYFEPPDFFFDLFKAVQCLFSTTGIMPETIKTDDMYEDEEPSEDDLENDQASKDEYLYQKMVEHLETALKLREEKDPAFVSQGEPACFTERLDSFANGTIENGPCCLNAKLKTVGDQFRFLSIEIDKEYLTIELSTREDDNAMVLVGEPDFIITFNIDGTIDNDYNITETSFDIFEELLGNMTTEVYFNFY